MYEAAEAFFLPVIGAAMTPGEVNTGNNAQSPLVSLTGVTANPDGTVAVTFSSPVSQLLSGNGGTASPNGAGITITDANGVVIPTVDAIPTTTGLGTSTLTLSFTGSGVSGGFLPAGNYRLNFVGNGFVANGRAVDVENNETEVDSFASIILQVGAPAILVGDYNDDGTVDAADYTVWRNNVGGLSGSIFNRDPDNGTGLIGEDDYLSWKEHYGESSPGSGGMTLVVDAPAPQPAISASTSLAAETVATPTAVDMAFIDVAITRPLKTKAAGAAAASLRKAAGGSAPIDHLLTLAARRHGRTTGPDGEETRCLERGERGDHGFGDIDEVFAALGKLRRAI